MEGAMKRGPQLLVLATAAILACSDDAPATGGGGAGGAPQGGAAQGGAAQGAGPQGAGGAGGAAASGGASEGGGGAGGGAAQGGAGGQGGAPELTVAACYADDFINPQGNGPDYDQFAPTVGSHCMGTNHQDITGIERVVFIGDSVTVGTPPTLSGDYYRNELADRLVDKFGLQGGNLLWQTVNVFNGVTNVQSSGDFASCAKWGARTDDLLVDNSQLADCFPSGELDKRTLVIMTVGGNDISALTQAAIDGAPEDALWAQTTDFVQKMRDAVAWLKEPGRFPNGVFVVFGNMYEFTDGTGEVQSCDVSGLAGFDEPVPSPALLAEMVIWANEQYVKTAVDYGADVIFLLEDFCGHGFERDNPSGPCYRGPGTEGWFDLTCIHPNPAGHDHIADMFMAVVDE